MKKFKSIIVTGAAGFIGAALCKKLLKNNEFVIGVDNLNNYYDPKIKLDRLKDIESIKNSAKQNWRFFNISIEDKISLKQIFADYNPRVVVHLAAQAGVRHSISNPDKYISSNLLGFGNILELCRHCDVENFIYASSSSVYGGNKSLPFKEDDNVNHPVSLYAATKRANELMAHSYSHLYKIPSTGLRFFTVYGPWGRPDMAPMIFARAILSKKPISVFNYGEMTRDFTYIEDIVDGVFRCCYKPATKDFKFDPFQPNTSSSEAPHRIFNIGCNNPVKILDFISILEDNLGVKAIKNFIEMQPGDVVSTFSDNDKIKSWISFEPSTTIEMGITKFAKWYIDYFKIKL